MEIVYKVLTPEELGEFRESLLDFLDKDRTRPLELWRSLMNSSYIIIALDGEKVIGSNQIITDRYFVAFFVNLIVDPSYRKKGIGGKIIEMTIEQARKLEVKWLELVPDPSHPWLNTFYAKYGFKEGVYMYTK